MATKDIKIKKMKKEYKILSKKRTHKGEIGYYVGEFQYNDEPYYTLKLKNEGFRSYPVRNLELQKPKLLDKQIIDKLLKAFKKALLEEIK